MSSEPERKGRDLYDWLDLASKWVVPFVVGLLVWWWNADRTEDQTRTAMMNVAVAVLNTEPSAANSALRDWAISVLENPEAAPPLTPQAAEALRRTALPWQFGWVTIDKLGDIDSMKDLIDPKSPW